MKVILLQDVARIGKRFEVVTVPDGHALNFLIPRKMAEPATSENVKKLESRKGALDAKKAQTDKALAETCEKLNGAVVTIAVQANEQGHLFKGLKAADIASAVAKEYGAIDASHIALEAPIKEAGEYSMNVTAGDAACAFTLRVESAK